MFGDYLPAFGRSKIEARRGQGEGEKGGQGERTIHKPLFVFLVTPLCGGGGNPRTQVAPLVFLSPCPQVLLSSLLTADFLNLPRL